MVEKTVENLNDTPVIDKNNCCKSVRNYFREYCRCTSIHGFRYFGEKRTIFERVWWFVIFIICLAACVVSIYEVYKKWERSPVIVSFATRGTPIHKIPFPAVTICPEIKSKSSRFNFTQMMWRKKNNIQLTPIESRNFEYMSLICNHRPELNYTNDKTFPNDFFDIIDKLKPDFLIDNCKYMGFQRNCSQLFTPIITDEGVCYVFNILDRDEIFRENVVHYSNYHQVHSKSGQWSVDDGYSDDADAYAYPRRALLSGAKNAFTVSLITNRNDTDYACRNSLLGYRVLLHTPMRLPRPSQEYFQVPLNQAVVGVVQPNMIVTSDSVKMYNARRRECYFPSERRLKYFKIYTQLNCKMECLTNYTLDLCGCVNFFMPRENGTEICGTERIACMWRAEAITQMKNVVLLINEEQKSFKPHSKKKSKTDCDCMPICSDLSYDVETSQSDWEWDKETTRNRYEPKSYYKSSLTIYFKSNHFITSQRHELYGPTDFLANFGGLLGLFTGFSVLSLMEIIYFLTVRMICNTRLYGYWAGPEN